MGFCQCWPGGYSRSLGTISSTLTRLPHSPARDSLVVVLDKLLKGAASQALQKLYLALGLDEYCGIPPT